jgi:DNA-nicking Smr family endonuclease
VDFKDILDEWERRNPQSGKGPSKDADPGNSRAPGEKRRRLLAKKPDAVLDLHGLTRDEAWSALDMFFEDARNRGFEKVLIVHGKGNHAAGKTVPSATGSAPPPSPLKTLVRTFLERCPLAGENGYGSSREGGSGATWVLIRRRGPWGNAD